MIEVVQNSKTLASIMIWNKKGQNKTSLYDWLKSKNQAEHRYLSLRFLITPVILTEVLTEV